MTTSSNRVAMSTVPATQFIGLRILNRDCRQPELVRNAATVAIASVKATVGPAHTMAAYRAGCDAASYGRLSAARANRWRPCPLRTKVYRATTSGHRAPTSSRVWGVTRKKGAAAGFFAPAWPRHLSHQQKAKPGGGDPQRHSRAVARYYLYFLLLLLKRVMTVMTSRQPHAP